jgi:hypothetical protein
MNLKTTEKLLQLLRHHGVQHFKTAEVEIGFGQVPVSGPVAMPEPLPTSAVVALAEPKAAATEIPHYINEVANLLKLSDNELVEKLFPMPSEDTHAND